MKDRFRSLYIYLLENGELLNLFPNFTGEWDKDSVNFIKEQLELESLANEENLDYEDGDY